LLALNYREETNNKVKKRNDLNKIKQGRIFNPVSGRGQSLPKIKDR